MSTHINETKEEQKNLLIAMMLIVAVLFGFDFIFPSDNQNKVAVPIQPTVTQMSAESVPAVDMIVPSGQKAPINTPTELSVENDFVLGAIGTNGGNINALDGSAVGR